jgi:hypothetical protein
VLCLTLAVLFAGCGSTGTGGRTDTPAGTVTPAPVPTAERPTVREGVDGRRLVGLAERHEAALAGRSFTALGRRVVTGPVGVLLDVRWERRVSADRETHHEVRSGIATWGWDGRDPVDRRHRYHAGNRTLTRYESGGEVRYEVDPDPPPGGTVADLDGADRLRELFEAFGSWRVVRHPNGSLALSGRGLDRPDAVGATAPLSDPRNATVEVGIEPDGRVARAAVRFEATVDGMPASVVEVRRYVGVGGTVVGRPPWYGTALEAGTANATGATAAANATSGDRTTGATPGR